MVDSGPTKRFVVRDCIKWFGHSVVAGVIMFLGLWLLVPDFGFQRAAWFGLTTISVAFFGGLLYFGVVYVLARSAK